MLLQSLLKKPRSACRLLRDKEIRKVKLGTKIKMAETSDLVAVVKAGDRYFMNTRNIKEVVLGGCGS